MPSGPVNETSLAYQSRWWRPPLFSPGEQRLFKDPTQAPLYFQVVFFLRFEAHSTMMEGVGK